MTITGFQYDKHKMSCLKENINLGTLIVFEKKHPEQSLC